MIGLALRRLVLDPIRVVGWWLLPIAGLAAVVTGIVFVALDSRDEVVAEGQVGVGTDVSFFDLDPMQISVEQTLDQPEFLARLAQTAGFVEGVELSADRSLGTRSFITIEAVGKESRPVKTTLDAALGLLVEDYNIAIAPDVVALEERRVALQAEVDALQVDIAAHIALEAESTVARFESSEAYELFEQSRTERSVLERQRNALVDDVNRINGTISNRLTGRDPNTLLRVLAPAQVTSNASNRLLPALIAGVGTGFLGLLSLLLLRRDQMPVRTRADLDGIGVSVKSLHWDPTESGPLDTLIRRNVGDTGSLAVVGSKSVGPFVAESMAHRFPDSSFLWVGLQTNGEPYPAAELADVTSAIIVLERGVTSAAHARVCEETLRGAGIPVVAIVGAQAAMPVGQ